MMIYYLSHSHVPSEFANSIQIMHMCQAFLQNGNELILFAKIGTLYSKDDYSYYGLKQRFQIIKSYRPKHIWGGIIYVYSNFKKIIEMPKPDLFYGRDPYNLWFIRHLGVPILYEVHSPPRNKFEYFCQKQIFKNSDFGGLIAISCELKKEYMRLFPQLRKKRITVAPDGAQIYDVAKDKKNKLADWPGRANALQIGYIGHLYVGKGMEIIIPMAEKLPGVDFHIVGGFKKHIEYWKGKSCGIKNLYYHGFKKPSDVSLYLHKMDIALAPYQEKVIVENDIKDEVGRWMSPLKIFEYMAAAKPIIASDLPILREILTHDSTAIMVPSDKPDRWVEAVNRLDDLMYRKKLGDQARQEFEENYTWEQRALRVLDILNKKDEIKKKR